MSLKKFENFIFLFGLEIKRKPKIELLYTYSQFAYDCNTKDLKKLELFEISQLL